MMVMRVVTLGIAALLVVGAAATQDLKLPPGRWWENPRLVEEIGLSEAQREEIRDLVYQHVRRMVGLKADVERASIDLKERVDREALDVEAVRAAYEAFQKARMRLERERFELLLAVRQVFTVGQWERLDRLRDRADGRRAPPARRKRNRPGP
jgi:Spy/CpxP family protein refolding chaperone